MRSISATRFLTSLAVAALAMFVTSEGLAQRDAPESASTAAADSGSASFPAPIMEFSILVNSVDHTDLVEAGQLQLKDFTQTTVEVDGQRARWVRVAKDSAGEDRIINPIHGTLSRTNEDVTPPVREYLVLILPEAERLTNRELKSADIGLSQSEGAVLAFEFNETGARRMHDLTFRYQPLGATGHKAHLAIILQDEIRAAPTINDVISGGNGQISGRFTEEELNDLNQAFRAAGIGPPAEMPARIGPMEWLLSKQSWQFVAAIFVIILLSILLCVRRFKPSPPSSSELPQA